MTAPRPPRLQIRAQASGPVHLEWSGEVGQQGLRLLAQALHTLSTHAGVLDEPRLVELRMPEEPAQPELWAGVVKVGLHELGVGERVLGVRLSAAGAPVPLLLDELSGAQLVDLGRTPTAIVEHVLSDPTLARPRPERVRDLAGGVADPVLFEAWRATVLWAALAAGLAHPDRPALSLEEQVRRGAAVLHATRAGPELHQARMALFEVAMVTALEVDADMSATTGTVGEWLERPPEPEEPVAPPSSPTEALLGLDPEPDDAAERFADLLDPWLDTHDGLDAQAQAVQELAAEAYRRRPHGPPDKQTLQELRWFTKWRSRVFEVLGAQLERRGELVLRLAAGPPVVAVQSASLLPRLGAAGEAALLRMWRSDDRGLRVVASFHVPATPEVLASGARDPDPVIREYAAARLGAAGDEATALLGELAADDEHRVREEAVKALGKLGPAAIPALVELAGDPDARIRQRTAAALGSVGVDDRVLEALAALAVDDEASVSRAAVRAHVVLGLPALERLVDLDPSSGWLEGVVALERHGDAAIPALVRLVDRTGRYAHVLPARGEAALPHLERLVEEGPEGVRLDLARSLPNLGSQAAPLLRRLAGDPSPEVGSAALESLRGMAG